MAVSRRILVLSFYYPPDLSAGSFRVAALVRAMRAIEPSAQIDVVTTQPNRYNSFSKEAPPEETDGALTVRRIAIPRHRSGMRDQAIALLVFWRRAAKLVRDRHYDLVFATSSRLMTAALGAYIARRAGAPLYLDIRDIFVDTMKDILPGAVAKTLHPVLAVIERRTIATASRVNLVSPGFASYFTERYPAQSYSFFTNGIDDEFLGHASFSERHNSRVLRVVYAGNVGEGQGLHQIIPSLAQRLEGRAHFRVIGDGGRRSALQTALAHLGVSNVELIDPMPRGSLLAEYLAADILFLHLNNYPAFHRVLPSKLFEYAALGKPIWAGVPGYAADFARTEITNAALFPPCDVEQALAAFNALDMRDSPRETFVQKFERKTIMQTMASEVLSHARSPGRA